MRLFLALLFLLMVAACSPRRSNEPIMFSPGVVKPFQIASSLGGGGYPIHFGSLDYAPVSREWVEWYYANVFMPEISEGPYGTGKWSFQTRCAIFTSRFTSGVGFQYLRQAWHHPEHSKAGKRQPAVGDFWYKIGGNAASGTDWHALVAVWTENGLEFFEPQNGKWVFLTREEISSAASNLRKFN